MANLEKRAAALNIVNAFSAWLPWTRRLNIPDGRGGRASTYGGVYLLAHFDRTPPEGPAKRLDDEVFYVGESNALGGRWNKFQRSAQKGLSGHSGGHSYRARAEALELPAWDQLHVAAMPIHFDVEGRTDAAHSLARRFRLFTEQRVLWELVQHRRLLDAPLNLLNKK